MRLELLCFSHQTEDSKPIFALVLDEGMYIFNVPEGTQRILSEYKWKATRIRKIFLTSLEDKNIGGLVGLILTMLGVEKFVPSLVGPEKTTECMLKDVAYEDNPDYLPTITLDHSDENIVAKQIKLSQTVAYDIQVKDHPGKFLPQKARELGVKPGPSFKLLSSGHEIILENGTVIEPSMVLTPPTRGEHILVVDARSIDDVKILGDLSDFSIVVHLSPIEQLLNEEYQKAFQSVKTNITYKTDGEIIFKAVNKLYSDAAEICPNILLPLACGKHIDLPNLYTEMSIGDAFILAPLEKKGFNFLKKEIKVVEGKIPKSPNTAITFLGSGSKAPTKYRNTPGLLLHTKHGYIAIDPGEDYTGQLQRKFGFDNASLIFRNLKAIWVSHIHGDHYFGLHQLVNTRVLHTQERITLQANQNIIDTIKFHDVDDKFKLDYKILEEGEIKLDGIKLTSIPVQHCPGSHGLLINVDDLSIAYSGDRNQKDDFVEKVGCCDILIHEATFDNDKAESASEFGHSTIGEAIETGKRLGAKYTLLTHVSSRYSDDCLNSTDENSFFVFDYITIPIDSIEDIKKSSASVFKKILENE